MLKLTEPAQRQLEVAIEGGEMGDSRLRVFIDHRCHCGKAHLRPALDGKPSAKDTAFEVGSVPFLADAATPPELPNVEINFVETVWTKGFTIRNVDHQYGAHITD